MNVLDSILGLQPEAFQVVLGSFGVTLLLLAFFLNLFKLVDQDSKVYIILNILGAGISCYASFLIHYTPFIILEAVWCLVAVIALASSLRRP
ncbi:MAG TPA: hypothetical protein VGM31_01965 [Puia sp.]